MESRGFITENSFFFSIVFFFFLRGVVVVLPNELQVKETETQTCAMPLKGVFHFLKHPPISWQGVWNPGELWYHLSCSVYDLWPVRSVSLQETGCFSSSEALPGDPVFLEAAFHA